MLSLLSLWVVKLSSQAMDNYCIQLELKDRTLSPWDVHMHEKGPISLPISLSLSSKSGLRAVIAQSYWELEPADL